MSARPRYLLDTHAFVWLSLGLKAIPPQIDDALGDPETRVFVSTISAYEVATKVRLGKWDQAARVLMHWERAASGLGVEQVSPSAEHALRAGMLDWANRDPFDRLIVAQAQVNALVLVTADRAVQAAPELNVLRW